MLTVAFIAFMLFQYVGDPVTNILGQDATPQQRQQLRADLGLDSPFPVQFARFVANAVRGEFGLSLRQGRKVSSLIAERLPATLELTLLAALIALAFGIPMGVYSALKRGTFVSQAMMTISLIGVSLPTFLIGILLILVFAVTLKWLPSFGRGEVVAFGPWTTGMTSLDGWRHLLLPARGHSADGLMRACWSRNEFQRAAHGQLRFSADEIAQIRAGLDASVEHERGDRARD